MKALITIANVCEIAHNVFESNGDPNGCGCGVHFERRARDNRIENDSVIGGTPAGIYFCGSTRNRLTSNVLVGIAPCSDWDMVTAFVLHHCLKDATTQPEVNAIERSTVGGYPRTVVAKSRARKSSPKLYNCFVNDLFARCRLGSTVPAAARIATESNLWYECSRGEDHGAFGLPLKSKRSLTRLFGGGASGARTGAVSTSSSTGETNSHSSPVSIHGASGDTVKKEDMLCRKNRTFP